MKNFSFSIKFLALLLCLPMVANAQTYLVDRADEYKTLGVRLGDLVRHGDTIDGLSSVNEYVLMNANTIFGAHEQLHIVSLKTRPYTQRDLQVYPLQAFVQYDDDDFYFQNITVTRNSRTGSLIFTRDSSIDLQRTKLEMEVGLIDRVLLITDKANDIRISFPLGVGSFDMGLLNDEVSLMTPRFRTGFLSKRNVIKSRTRPRYFAGKPFVRVLWGDDKEYTAIGFHAQPNLDPFIRAFDSSGCLRMQVDDLMALYYLVRFNPDLHIPISINYETSESVDHPFPKRDHSHRSVENVGTKANPMYTLNRDRLIQTHVVNSAPPVQFLIDFPEDDYHEYFTYSSEMCRIKSFEREPSRGWSPSLTDNPLWERCEERTRRNRIYRFFVH